MQIFNLLFLALCIRGDTYMTSAMRGREGVGLNMMIVLIGCVNGSVIRGRGFKNPKILRTSFKYRPLYISL